MIVKVKVSGVDGIQTRVFLALELKIVTRPEVSNPDPWSSTLSINPQRSINQTPSSYIFTYQ